MSVAGLALLTNLQEFIAQGNAPLTALASLMLALLLWMVIEGLIAARKIAPG
jgi:hypothetical protein